MPDEISTGPAVGGDIATPMAAPAAGGFGDYAIGGPAYGAGVPFQGFGGGNFSGIGLSDVSIGSGVATGMATDAVAGQAATNPIASAESQMERHASAIVSTTDRSSANLIISTDEKGQQTHTWQKEPSAADNYQTKVFVDEKMRSNTEAVHSELEKAKTEMSAKGIDLQVPATDKLPDFSKKDAASDTEGKEEGEDGEDKPNPPGGGGGGGGGCQPQPKDDPEDKEDPEKEAEKEAGKEAANDKSTSKNILDETVRQLDKNGGINYANLASYAGGLWNGSMLSGLFSQYDKDGDGKLDPDEMAAMKADPKYQSALDEMKNKIGNDPALADFKNKLDSADGLNSLNQLQKAGATATAEHVNKVFDAGAKTAIEKLAVSQELKSAGITASDSISADPAKQKDLIDNKMKPILEKLVNGKKKEDVHVFTF